MMTAIKLGLVAFVLFASPYLCLGGGGDGDNVASPYLRHGSWQPQFARSGWSIPRRRPLQKFL